ncbi:hypothetical protein OBE_08635, partial [human gut metagenome]
GWYVYAYFLYLFRDHIERKRFGANIGNEDEEEEDTENPENPSDEPSGETINQAVEGEREDNPLSAVETITVESKAKIKLCSLKSAFFLLPSYK